MLFEILFWGCRDCHITKRQLPKRISCQLPAFRNFDLISSFISKGLISLNTKLYVWAFKAVLSLYSYDWMKKLFREMFCSAFSVRKFSLWCVTKQNIQPGRHYLIHVLPTQLFCVIVCVCAHMCFHFFPFRRSVSCASKTIPQQKKKKKGGVKSARVVLWQTDIYCAVTAGPALFLSPFTLFSSPTQSLLSMPLT